MLVFLGLNRLELKAEESEVVALMLGVASGKLRERELADWLKERLRRNK